MKFALVGFVVFKKAIKKLGDFHRLAESEFTGFMAVLVLCGAILVVTFFLKDLPMTAVSADKSQVAGASEVREEETPVIS